MRQEQALAVLRIANAIIEEIPVQAIHARIVRVTARTRLPALEANCGVIEIEFAQPGGRHLRRGPEREWTPPGAGSAARSTSLSVSEK